MSDKRGASPLAAILGLIAALLAWTAVALGYARHGTFDWGVAAAGLFCAALAWNAWTRYRREHKRT